VLFRNVDTGGSLNFWVPYLPSDVFGPHDLEVKKRYTFEGILFKRLRGIPLGGPLSSYRH